MAINKLKSRFNKELDKSIKRLYGGYAKGLGSTVIVNFLLGGSSAVTDFIKGTNKVLDQMKLAQGVMLNDEETWKKAIIKCNKEIKRDRKIGTYTLRTYKDGRAAVPKPGIYLGAPLASDDFRLDLILYAKNNAGTERMVKTVWDFYTKKVWQTWVEINVPGMTEGQQSIFVGDIRESATIERQNSKKKLVKQSAISAFRLNTKKEHAISSTRAMFAVKELEKSNPPLHDDISLEMTDVVQYIKNNINVDWDQVSLKKKLGNYNYDNAITLKLGSNPQLRSDRKNIKAVAERFFRQEIESGRYGNVFGDISQEASKSIRKQVAEDAGLDITKPMTKSGRPDMRFKVNKAKAFKPARRKAPLKKQRADNSTTVKRVAVAKSLKARPQKIKRTEKTNLMRLEKQINARLPAEVRRNMGRPALRNQTGRFSNSVEVKNLRETAAGISGEYSYQLSPYETFENTGSRQWPTGYNPKPLIAKSIRNLAMGLTETKLVSLRRT